MSFAAPWEWKKFGNRWYYCKPFTAAEMVSFTACHCPLCHKGMVQERPYTVCKKCGILGHEGSLICYDPGHDNCNIDRIDEKFNLRH